MTWEGTCKAKAGVTEGREEVGVCCAGEHQGPHCSNIGKITGKKTMTDRHLHVRDEYDSARYTGQKGLRLNVRLRKLHHIPITSYAAKREILCRGEEGALFLVYPHLFKEKKEKGCTAVCLQGQLRWVKGCLKPSHTLLE
eukprot:scaffold62310_cov22-Tisochrysis_lutea.AAC.2